MRVTQALRDALLPLAARLPRRRHRDAGDAVLIMQPDHLGDILLSQPAARRLRAAFPERRLIGVVGPWSAEIARLAWPVDEIVTVAFPGFTREPSRSPLDPYRQLFAEAHALAPFGAAAAAVLRPDAWWAAWLARASGVAQVAGADDARVRRFATRLAPLADGEHAVVRACAIADALIGVEHPRPPTPRADPLELPVSEAASEQARELTRVAGVGAGYVVVHPGAGAEVKHWPSHRWRAVVAALLGQGLAVIVTGSDAERDLAAALVDGQPGAVSVAGRTPLPALIELLRGATLVLGPDSGPLHLAVATGTPTVHLFGPSDPCRYGPWGPAYNHIVARAGWSCPRCGDLSSERQAGCGCLLAVGVGDVLRAAWRLLGSHAAP